MNVEATFDLLADAAGVRHPNPERENRGLCPAHLDSHNPALVFRIADSGKLVTHCFAQGCTVEDLAAAIGVPVAAFFPEGWSGRVRVPTEYVEPSLLDLLKLLPLTYSFDEQVDAVFRVLNVAYDIGVIDNDTIDVEQPMRSLPLIVVENYVWQWCRGWYEYEDHGPWPEVFDSILSFMRALNRERRTHAMSTTPAIPRRG